MTIYIRDEYRPFFKRRFVEWLALNEHIYAAFERETLRIIKAGRTHYSARTIVEVLVHESILCEVGGDGFKIGNDRAPDLARLFVLLHPQHRNFWEYRRPDYRNFLAALPSAQGTHCL